MNKSSRTGQTSQAATRQISSDDIVIQEEMPPIDWPSMGRYVYMAKFKDKKDMDSYFRFILE